MEVRVLKMKKKLFFIPFYLCKKSGDDTTNIETLYFQTVFNICISDKFLDKDQSFQDTLCHKHYKTPCVINIIIYLVIQKRTV